jgi:hypothetical protein
VKCTPRWQVTLLLATALIASGCGGGSSDNDGTAKSAMAVEPKAVSLKRCLADDGYAVQREGAALVQATRDGRSFVNIREFPSEAEATAYDGGLTVAAHVKVGAKVASGDSARDVKPVERCLRAEAP